MGNGEVMNKQQQEYAEALDEIDRKVAAGEMTNGEAFVWREQLAAEMKVRTRPTWQKVLIFIAVVIVAFILLRFAVAIIQR